MSSAKDVFRQHLRKESETRQANAPLPRTVSDFVRICLPDIRRAIKQKTSWEIIAKAIHAVAKETYGVEIRIAPSTAKRAYYHIIGKNAGRSRSTTSFLPEKSRIQPVPTTAPDTTPVPQTAEQSAAEPMPTVQPTIEVEEEVETPQQNNRKKPPKSRFNVPAGVNLQIL